MSQPPVQNTARASDRWAAFRGLAWWQLVLSLLPLALIAIGGLIGGAIGAVGMWVNLKVARSAIHPGVKALVMLLIVGAAYVVWSFLAALVLAALNA